MQVDRADGPSARLDKGRTADRKQVLLVQRLLEQTLRARRSGLAHICDPHIETAPGRIDAAMVGLQLDDDAGVGQLEIREPRHEPLLGHDLDRNQFQPLCPGIAAAALRDDPELGQNALDILQIRLAAPVQADAAMTALEQRAVEMLFQYLDAVRNGRR